MQKSLQFLSERDIDPASMEGNNAMSGITSTTTPSSSTPRTSTAPSIPTHLMSLLTTNVTDASSTNHTGVTGRVTSPPEDDGSTGTIIAIVTTIVLICILLGLVYYHLKKTGKLYRFGFSPVRRRASTSDSRRVLDDPVNNDITMTSDILPRPGDRDDIAFSIEDHEDHAHPGGDEEYYYDEVFGQSPFGDARTNTSVRELYNMPQEQEEEVLDFDFETLGIKIDDYKIEPSRKLTM